MGKLEEFEISFTDNKVVYRPGDPITGTVKITNAEPIQCKGKKKITCVAFTSSSTYLYMVIWKSFLAHLVWGLYEDGKVFIFTSTYSIPRESHEFHNSGLRFIRLCNVGIVLWGNLWSR